LYFPGTGNGCPGRYGSRKSWENPAGTRNNQEEGIFARRGVKLILPAHFSASPMGGEMLILQTGICPNETKGFFSILVLLCCFGMYLAGPGDLPVPFPDNYYWF
jgi:hypothetical protein